MAYAVTKLNYDEIDQNTKNKLSFLANPELLEAFAKRDGAVFYYLGIIEHSKIIAIMPVFEKKKFGMRYLIQPIEYKYTPIDFFLTDSLSLFRKQNHQLMILKTLALYLKKEYFKLMIDFESSIQDIRAFKWVGLDVEPLYTYTKVIKEDSSEKLPTETKRQLNNKAKKELHIKECWDLDIYKTLSIDMLNHQNRQKRQVQKGYFSFLDDLCIKGFCAMYVAYKEEKPLVYLIVLKDPQKSFLYAFYSALSEEGKKLGANIYCYDYVLNNHKDFEIFDFTGANIENIAFFKSQFNCELVNYFRIEKKIM